MHSTGPVDFLYFQHSCIHSASAENLAKLIQLVADNGANVLEIYHEREDAKTEVNSCTVTLTLETKDAEHIRKICNDMVESGYPLLD